MGLNSVRQPARSCITLSSLEAAVHSLRVGPLRSERNKIALLVPVVWPRAGRAHSWLGACGLEGVLDPGRGERCRWLRGECPDHQRSEHSVYAQVSRIDFVTGVSTGMRVAALPGLRAVRATTMQPERGDTGPEKRPVVTVAVWLVANRYWVPELFCNRSNRLSERSTAVGERTEVAEPARTVDVDDCMEAVAGVELGRQRLATE